MKIIQGDRPEQWRILRDDDLLCGLITRMEDGRYKVDAFMRIEYTLPTKDEAFAFLRGCEQTLLAFNLFKKASGDPKMTKEHKGATP